MAPASAEDGADVSASFAPILATSNVARPGVTRRRPASTPDARSTTCRRRVGHPGLGRAVGSDHGPSYEAIMLGDNAFGHAISLPVELRDGGVLDFGREHALAWYSIWGWGVVTESSVVKIVTN